jgi:cyclopropane fatty-acyl-phospholipid synthase-like methyltransferase
VSLNVPADWFDGFFEGEWLDHLALGASPEWTEAQVAFLVEQLGLHEGTRVLDLACGRGRIAIPLAQRGCRVTGIDLSPRSLELARRDAEAAGVELELVRRDMR